MAKRGRKKGQLGKCGICGETGHNARTCPSKNKPAAKPAKKVKKSKDSKSKPAPKKSNDSKSVVAVELKSKAVKPFDLDDHICQLLLEEPYFAALSRRINKSATSAISTAGVCIDPEDMRYKLLYNNDFMAAQTREHRLGILLHEFFHLALLHCSSRRDRLGLAPVDFKHPTVDEQAKLMQWNIACDLAINCHLEGKLPDSCCMPGKGPFEKYSSFLGAEEYYKLLSEDEDFQKKMEQAKQNARAQSGQGNPKSDDQSGSGSSGAMDKMKKECGQFDDHNNWDKDADGNQASEAAQDIAKETLKNAMRKAVNEAAEKQSWGSVSGPIREYILRLLQGRIDWRKALRYFIRVSQKAEKSGSIRRINKRFPYIHPGKKTNRQAELAICIDQSGSVSDEMLEKFFAELNKLSSLASFTVVPFDCTVAEDKVYRWQRGQHKPVERVTCGGTSFQAPTDWVNERCFDGMVILTDMEAPQPTRGKTQRMWITDEKHDPAKGDNNYVLKPKWGERVVVIPDM